MYILHIYFYKNILFVYSITQNAFPFFIFVNCNSKQEMSMFVSYYK